jgi:hypothetical protein
LNCSNIDDLILNDVQVKKLFKSVVDENLKKINDVDITNSELSDDLNALFDKELELFLSNSKRYND